jgi:hypothetical protein
MAGVRKQLVDNCPGQLLVGGKGAFDKGNGSGEHQTILPENAVDIFLGAFKHGKL